MTTTVRESLAQQGFTILQEIGEDPLRGIYLVQNEITTEPETMYILRTPNSESPLNLMVTKEARQLQEFQDDHVLALGKIGAADSFPFACYENRPGHTLAELLTQGQTWDQTEAIKLLLPIIKSLATIHQNGWIHGRLMPETLLITDEDQQAMIAELGLSYLFRYEEGAFPSSKTHRVNKTLPKDGTLPADPGWWNQSLNAKPEYSSPEQAENLVDRFGPETDIYSIGCVLYELLTQRPPLQGKTAHETLLQAIETIPELAHSHNPNVSETLSLIVRRCLEKNPKDRYHSAEDLANDLEAFLQGEESPQGIAHYARSVSSPFSDVVQGVILACGILIGLVGSSIFVSVNAPSTLTFQGSDSKKQPPQNSGMISSDLITFADKHLEPLTRTIKEHHPHNRASQDHYKQVQDVMKQYKNSDANTSDLPKLARQSANAAWIAASLNKKDHAQELMSLVHKFQKQLQTVDLPSDHEKANVATSEWYLAKAHQKLANVREAKKWFKIAVQNFSEFVNKEGSYYEQYCKCVVDEAELYVDAEQVPSSIQLFQKATDLLKQLLDNDPTNPRYQKSLMRISLRLATVEASIHHRDEAIQALELTLETAENLLKNETYKDSAELTIAQAHRQLATIYMDQRKYTEARKSFQDAIKHLKELIQQHPKVFQYQSELLTTFNTELKKSVEKGDLDSISTFFDQYDERFNDHRHLIDDKNATTVHQVSIYLARAMVQQRKRQLDKAIEWVELALKFAEEIHEKNEVAKELYIESHQRLGKYYGKTNQDIKANQSWQTVCELLPDSLNDRLQLAESWCRLQNRIKADQCAKMLWISRSDLRDVQQFDLACVYGKLLKMNEREADSEGKSMKREAYLSRGIALLQALQANKVFARSIFRRHLLKDPDLEPFRSSEGYRQIIQNLPTPNGKKGTVSPSRRSGIVAKGN